MRSVQTFGSTQGQRPRVSPACLALTGTVARLLSESLSGTPSTFLSPLAPRPLRRFSATMGTLTPRKVSHPTEVSPLHVTRHSRPFCLQSPNAPHRRFHTLPLSSMGLPSRGQGFATCLQARRVRQAESSSSPADWSLTSGCSPHRLGRRSYLRFPGRRAYAWEGFTPSYVCARGRTSTAPSGRMGRFGAIGPGAEAPRYSDFRPFGARFWGCSGWPFGDAHTHFEK